MTLTSFNFIILSFMRNCKFYCNGSGVKGKFIFLPAISCKYIIFPVIHIFFYFRTFLHIAYAWISNFFIFVDYFFVFTSWQASLPLVQLTQLRTVFFSSWNISSDFSSSPKLLSMSEGIFFCVFFISFFFR